MGEHEDESGCIPLDKPENEILLSIISQFSGILNISRAP